MTTNATNNLVPIISKAQFDDEATAFLKKYYPEALKIPMAVPIADIARNKMGLTVITDTRLSEDLSILGQMCFTSGLVIIYDKDEDEYRNMKVESGTMFIDPDTYFLRNLGCLNNTVAHECFHWFRHRNYYRMQNILGTEQSVACRCPSQSKNENYASKWTDEDWMEWQANNIAPRILMPKQTFIDTVEKILNESHSNPLVVAGIIKPSQWIVEQLADFYQVSKISAEIRISELGISIP